MSANPNLRRSMSSCLALLAGLAAGTGAIAQGLQGAGGRNNLVVDPLAGPDARSLVLKGATIRTEVRSGRAGTALMQALPANAAAGEGAIPGRHVIQLDGPMTPARRAALEASGVRLGEYLPANAYVATLSGRASVLALDTLTFVQWASPFLAEWKTDPEIGRRAGYQEPMRKAIAANGEALLWVYLFPGEDPAPAAQALAAAGARVVRTGEFNGTNPVITAIARPASVNGLAAIGAVQYIEEVPEAVDRNNGSRASTQSGTLNTTPLYAAGLTGVGQIVGLQDSRMDVNHCSFRDASGAPFGPTHRKILAFNAASGTPAVHGTHTAGTLAGDNGVFDDTRGVAFGAKMVFNLTPSSTDLNLSSGTQFEARLVQHHGQGARVHSNSWGADGRTDYNGWSRAIDVFSRNNEDSVVAFAVSNGATATTPENGKSCLAVGAVQDLPNINSFCSGGTGPTADGRRKPEIFAPGCSILSASASTTCSTVSLTGTSMACPAITGAAALLRQYFTDGYYPTAVAGANPSQTPTGALVRALVLNGGQDITNLGSTYPSNQEGWGRLVAANVVPVTPGTSRKLIVQDVRNAAPNALTTGASNTRRFVVNSSGEQLRVTMTFTDVPASLSASSTPVNNINLEIVAPNGDVYRGNNFVGGVTAIGASFSDNINSTEQVFVNSPAVGLWTVRVVGVAVNQDTQGYGLVLTGDVEWGSACPGDVTADAAVTFNDLNAVLGSFGAVGLNLTTDANGDGKVDFADLNLVLSNFGVSCPQ